MNLNGDNVEIVVEYKKIKNTYMRINDDLQIYVTCPRYVTKFELKKLLEKNKDSLEKMYKKALDKKNKEGKILFLGEELDYVYYKKVIIDEGRAFGPSVEAINTYLEKNALPIFQERMDIYMPTYRHLPKFRLRTRNMKTRWGVCNKGSMTVTLNTMLIHKKPYLIDYVICHELAHFEHMDHSKAFWQCVEEHFPRYKEARKELKD